MSDWEPIPKEDSGWETIPEASFKASPTETFLHSLAPTGIASAAYGAKEAAPEFFSGDFEKALDTYRKNRDEAKKVLLESQKENPRAATLGNIVRAAPLPVLGPFGSAAYGGAEALADSSADLTRLNEEEQRKRLGKDVGAGMLLGGALGGVATVAPKATAAAGIGALTGEMVSPGEGALPGAAIGLAAKGAASPVVRSYLNKKFNNILLDTPEAVTERYMANPEAVRSAPSKEGVAQRIADVFGDIRKDVGPATEQAMSTLSKERVKNENMEVQKILKTLRGFNDPETNKLAERLQSEFISRAPGQGKKARPTTITRKSQFIPETSDPDFESGLIKIGDKINPLIEERVIERQVPGVYSPQIEKELQLFKVGETKKPIMSYVTPEDVSQKKFKIDKRTGLPVKEIIQKRIEGIPETSPGAEYLTERELYDVKKALSDIAGNWKSPLPTSEMARARTSSGDINQLLKKMNPDYEHAMGELAGVMRSKEGLGKKFGIKPDYTGDYESGFTYSDQTLSSLNDLIRGNKVDRKRILESIREQGYGDLADEIQNSLAKSALEGSGTMAGSRKAVMGGNVGMAVGAGIGGTVGGVPGAAIGGVIGKGVGSVAGGAMDKYGPRVAKASMDAQSQLGAMLQNPRMQKFAQPLKTAYERGGEKSYASTYFLMNQTDEEFRKALRDQDENQ